MLAVTSCGEGLRFADATGFNSNSSGNGDGNTVQVSSAGTPVAAQSSILATPIANVDGLPAVNVQVTLRDGNGLTVPNMPLSVTAFNVQPTTLQSRSVTDANGQFHVQVVSEFSGPKKIDAHFGAQHLQASVTFTINASGCAPGAFFGAPPMVSGMVNAHDVASGDINGDSARDLVFADTGNNTLVVALGNRTGRFAVLPGVPAGGGPTYVAVCHINNDTYDDVVVGNEGGLEVFTGSSTGTLTQAANFAVGSGTAWPVTCGDVNGDHLADPIINDTGANRLNVYLSNGSGTTFNLIQSSQFLAAVKIGMGQFNSDANLDAFVIDGAGTVSTALGNGDGTFGTFSNHTVAGNNLGAVAADVTGDGKVDIVSASQTALSLSILVGDGTGNFTLSPNTVQVPSIPIAVGAADLNGDAKIDLVATSSQAGAIFAALNKGAGLFQAPTAYPLSPGGGALDMNDYNGDAKIDLVTPVNNNGFAGGAVLLGRGDGTFADYQSYATDAFPRFVSAADMDNDGDLDLVVAAADGNDVQVFRNNGQGVYASPVAFPLRTRPSTMTTGDVNGDGWVDCVAAVDEASGGLLVLLNTRDGNLSAPVLYPASGNTWGSVIIDLNGDGRADLLTANRNGYTVAALFQQPDGTFGAPTLFPIGSESPASMPADLSVGDVNGDGFIDVLAPSYTGGTPMGLLGASDGMFGQALVGALGGFGVQTNTSGVATTDFNADGLGDVCTSAVSEGLMVYKSSSAALTATALLQSAAAWYAVYAGDLNGDGKPDMLGAAYSQAATVLYPGNGDGTFGSPLWYATGGQSYGISTGDFNGDGRIDFAQVNGANNTLGVHLNTGCP